MATTRKPKRKLTDISFEKEGAHVALVAKTQGGPANGHDYSLILKSANYSQEYIEKIQQIRVTMDLPDFLTRFFNLYGSDAEVLARMLGYVPDSEDEKEEYSYEKYIEERMEAFEIIKSLKDSDNIPLDLAALSQEQYLSVLQDQFKLESVFKSLDEKNSAPAGEGSTEAVAKAKVSDENNTKVEPSPSVDTNVELEKSMKLEEVQKSLDETKVELQKALDALAAVNAEKQEAIVKSKTAQIEAVVKNAEQAAVLVKAALLLDDASFDGFVAVVKDLATIADKSALFQEQGATSTEEVTKSTESAVAKALKLQLANAK